MSMSRKRPKQPREPKKNAHAVAMGRLGGKVGGKAKSRRKIRAARRNGALGGRPKTAERMAVETVAHRYYLDAREQQLLFLALRRKVDVDDLADDPRLTVAFTRAGRLLGRMSQ